MGTWGEREDLIIVRTQFRQGKKTITHSLVISKRTHRVQSVLTVGLYFCRRAAGTVRS